MYLPSHKQNGTFDTKSVVENVKMTLTGHSRTIIGVEEMVDGQLRLLLFDPSCNRKQMQQFLSGDITANLMRCLRRSLHSMKAKQYQIVAVIGVLSEQEFEVGYVWQESEIRGVVYRGGGTEKKVGGLTLPLNDCTEAGVQGLHSEEFFSPLASEKVVGLSPPPPPHPHPLLRVGGLKPPQLPRLRHPWLSIL